MIKKCPSCGKEFEILHADLWAYHINKQVFFCSWKCLRERENGEMNKLTREQKEEAVEIAIRGGKPLEYLAACGAKNPSGAWFQIKKRLMSADPDKLDAIKKAQHNAANQKNRAKKKAEVVTVDKGFPKAEVPEEVLGRPKTDFVPATVKVDGAMKIETPEANRVRVVEIPETPRITKPVNYGGFDVSAIRDRELGEFYFDHDHNCIDWRNGLGDEISLGPNGWKILLERLPKILQVLGVDV